MNTVRLNITIPASLNDEMNSFAEELNEKKSHIITSALEMYFDYLDIRVAEKRLASNEPTISMNEFFKELGVDVHD
jgi:metal-responsive CopG/Arc/MetJ family transcriptional regulator